MLNTKNKCNINEYDIEIDSELNYTDGYGLIELILNCVEIDSELPRGQLTIAFKDWDYYFPITKADNKRIANLLNKLGFDRQYVENIYEFNNCH